MTFELCEVDLEKDWDELFACEWAAWMKPRQSLWELTFPILGSGPSAEAEAINKNAARQLQGIKGDPRSRWMKIVDKDTGKIVAGALWKFYDSNPYRAPLEKTDATWLPEGELRDLCDSMYRQNDVWRPRVMPVAHARLCPAIMISLILLLNLFRPHYTIYTSRLPQAGHRRATRGMGDT